MKEIAQQIKNTYNEDQYQCFPCFCVEAREYIDWLYNVGDVYANTKYEDMPYPIRAVLMQLAKQHTEGEIKSTIDSLSQQYFLNAIKDKSNVK